MNHSGPTVQRVKNIVQLLYHTHTVQLSGSGRLAFVSNLGSSRIDSCRNGGMNVYCKETSNLENPWTREVMEPSNGWGPVTQLLGEAILISDGGTLPRVLFMLCLLSVIRVIRNHEAETH